MFWLSYESFSILSDVFCQKSVISSENSCAPFAEVSGVASAIAINIGRMVAYYPPFHFIFLLIVDYLYRITKIY